MADLGNESSVARDFNRDGVLFFLSVWQMWEPIESMKCCLLPFPHLFLWDQLFKPDAFQSEEGCINTSFRAKDIYRTVQGKPKLWSPVYRSFKAIIFGPSPPPKDIALFRTDGLVSTDDMEKTELLESYFDFIIFVRKNDLQFGKGRINMVRRN